jgi:hypothetical protein
MPLKQAGPRPPQNDVAGIARLHGLPAVVICGRFRLEIGSKNAVLRKKVDLRRSGYKSIARNRPRPAQYRSCLPSREQSRCRRPRGQTAGYPIRDHHLARCAVSISPCCESLQIVVEDDRRSVRLVNLQRRILPKAGQRAVLLLARLRWHRTSVVVRALLIERDRLRCLRDQLVEARIATQFIPARI